jgi:hypothetical protein
MRQAIETTPLEGFTSLGDVFRTIKQERLQEGIERIVPAYYWLAEHHCGQWSWEYEAQCRLGRVFSPGASWIQGGPEEEMYEILCAANGCDHEGLTP